MTPSKKPPLRRLSKLWLSDGPSLSGVSIKKAPAAQGLCRLTIVFEPRTDQSRRPPPCRAMISRRMKMNRLM